MLQVLATIGTPVVKRRVDEFDLPILEYKLQNFKWLRTRKKSDLQIDLMSGLERESFVMNLDEIDAAICNWANDATESNHWAIIDIT